jgi:hypothetical protein
VCPLIYQRGGRLGIGHCHRASRGTVVLREASLWQGLSQISKGRKGVFEFRQFTVYLSTDSDRESGLIHNPISFVGRYFESHSATA